MVSPHHSWEWITPPHARNTRPDFLPSKLGAFWTRKQKMTRVDRKWGGFLTAASQRGLPRRRRFPRKQSPQGSHLTVSYCFSEKLYPRDLKELWKTAWFTFTKWFTHKGVICLNKSEVCTTSHSWGKTKQGNFNYTVIHRHSIQLPSQPMPKRINTGLFNSFCHMKTFFSRSVRKTRGNAIKEKSLAVFLSLSLSLPPACLSPSPWAQSEKLWDLRVLRHCQGDLQRTGSFHAHKWWNEACLTFHDPSAFHLSQPVLGFCNLIPNWKVNLKFNE